jgi:hypothetical protein
MEKIALWYLRRYYAVPYCIGKKNNFGRRAVLVKKITLKFDVCQNLNGSTDSAPLHPYMHSLYASLYIQTANMHISNNFHLIAEHFKSVKINVTFIV